MDIYKMTDIFRESQKASVILYNIYNKYSQQIYYNFQNKENIKENKYFIDLFNEEVKNSDFCKVLESYKDYDMYDYYYDEQQRMVYYYEKELMKFYKYLLK